MEKKILDPFVSIGGLHEQRVIFHTKQLKSHVIEFSQHTFDFFQQLFVGQMRVCVTCDIFNICVWCIIVVRVVRVCFHTGQKK